MRRPLSPDELKIWAAVLSTVRARPGRMPPKLVHEPEPTPLNPGHRPEQPMVAIRVKPVKKGPEPRTFKPVVLGAAPEIEPRRKQRLSRERDPILARLDLHGMDQDRAHAVLIGFLQRAQDEGSRAVLVITGKGFLGDGILRRRTPEWLAAPNLRAVVAGVSEAHRRHGGEGALYVALKKKSAG